jgi:hypothetical protein
MWCRIARGRLLLAWLALVLLLTDASGASEDDRETPEGAGTEAEAAEENEESPETESQRLRRERRAELARSQEADPSNIESPIFPEVRYRDAVRLRLQTHFVPGADFGTYKADLYQPSLRARFTFPVSDRSVLQLTARGTLSHYNLSGSADPLGLGRPDLGELGTVSLVLQGAYRINESEYLFVDGEKWSLLANVFARSRWESRAFSDALTYGGSLAMGYQSASWRLALGLNLESPLTGSGVDVGFVGTLRWDPTDRLTIRNRGRGIQFEYQIVRGFEIFGAGYLAGQRYLLDAPGNITLRDSQTLVGAGFEWRISRHFRLNLEAGVVASHEIKVRADGGPTLSSKHADPGGYADLRIEIRP